MPTDGTNRYLKSGNVLAQAGKMHIDRARNERIIATFLQRPDDIRVGSDLRLNTGGSIRGVADDIN